MSEYNIHDVITNIDQYILDAQSKVENVSKTLIEAKRAKIEAQIDYESAYNQAIKKLHKEGKPITIIKELAKHEAMKFRRELIKSENMADRALTIYNGCLEQLNTFKKIKGGNV